MTRKLKGSGPVDSKYLSKLYAFRDKVERGRGSKRGK